MHILTSRNTAFSPSHRIVEGRVDGTSWFALVFLEVRKNANLDDRTREVFGKWSEKEDGMKGGRSVGRKLVENALNARAIFVKAESK